MLPDTDRQRLARDYGPMLDALQEALEGALGPVLWDPRADAAEATLRDGTTVLRVSAIHAVGVPTARLDLVAISTAVNHVLDRWGFPVQPPMTGSPSGHLVCRATDTKGARFSLLIKQAVDAWVDQPL
jgi:formate-dependent phosphoribosylglycinamide formyltransferase (GAR transformylase)